MKILTTSDSNIAEAAAALVSGALVAFPTETVYGLGGDAFNVSALARIFEVKNRPRFDPLIIHIAEIKTLERLVLMEALGKSSREKLELLSRRLWPGPLTLVLPKRPEVPGLATAGLSTAAIRLPASVPARKLISLSVGAVAAPSANLFGSLSPTRAEHVAAQLGEKVDFIIDGGRTGVGVESTVLDISGEKARLLRPGGVSREELEALIGPLEIREPGSAEDAPESPGQLKSHYAPGTPLYLFPRGELASMPAAPREGRLFFSSVDHNKKEAELVLSMNERVKILSPKGDLAEAAANFFDMLHELDGMGLDLIRAEEAPERGLGAAINDRLRRAAALSS